MRNQSPSSCVASTTSNMQSSEILSATICPPSASIGLPTALDPRRARVAALRHQESSARPWENVLNELGVLHRPGAIEPPLIANASKVLCPCARLGHQRCRIACEPDHREYGQA